MTASDPGRSFSARLLRFWRRWLADASAQQIFRSKLFWAVLILKVVAGSLLASTVMRDLFTPFVNYYVLSGFENPWEYFAVQGRGDAFPYSPVMLFFLVPFRLILTPFLPDGVSDVTFGHLFAMRVPLLICDFIILLILARWFPNRIQKVLLYYWCSPIVFYICFWHGQLDIIPTAILMASLHLLRHRHVMGSMILLGLGMATKMHLLVVLPFVVVYIYQDRGMRYAAGAFLASALTYVLMMAPYLSSPGFRLMVFGTDESARLFAFIAPIGADNLAVLLAPGAILLLWFRFVAYTKRNWDLFILYVGILFAVFIVLAPPRPAYLLWSLPFLIHLLVRSDRRMVAPYLFMVAAYFVFFWSGYDSDLTDAWRLVSVRLATMDPPAPLAGIVGFLTSSQGQNLCFTILQAALTGLALNMYLFGVRSNAVYRMRTNPILLGIAGDSGAGKDSIADLIKLLVGKNQVSIIAGDDYHKWPRGHEMWQVYTHLDVKGNRLHEQMEHAIALSRGKSIQKVHYDHSTGRFTEKETFDPNQIVIFQGLHSLSIEALRGMYDLKIFLDPDDDLRKFWKLRRDTTARGHSVEKVLKSFEDRAKDRDRFILPQREEADLVFSIVPKSPLDPLNLDQDPELALEVRASNSFDFGVLASALESVPGVQVEHDPFIDSRWQRLRIEGQVPADWLRQQAPEIVPNLDELAVEPEFVDGLGGAMQLVFLISLSHKLRWAGRSEQDHAW
ncbi:MAG TPA: hypothetical protein PLO61_03175 [Fimbriimonadaceae bacterium]|nr:hypothetical protein [Fimbriimonadaceae bacterium]HRJ32111.1 hypothetical protein [Fimbriimonadaceae bacterium]